MTDVGTRAGPQVKARRRTVRRSRDETRELLLAEATDLLLERFEREGEAGNPVAALRITDVLARINARSAPDTVRMTTGAAYQIWASQSEFQDAFLDHLMQRVAMPWLGRLRADIAEAIAQRRPFGEVVAVMGGQQLTTPRQDAELSLALGLTALVAPDRVREAEEEANAGYVREFGALLGEVLDYGRRRMRPGRSIEDLVWALEALAAGAHLRSRSHPDVLEREAGGLTLLQATALAIVDGLTEPAQATVSPTAGATVTPAINPAINPAVNPAGG